MSESSIAQTPEAVAFELLKVIGQREGKTINMSGSAADRAYIISTYAECLAVVKGLGTFSVPSKL